MDARLVTLALLAALSGPGHAPADDLTDPRLDITVAGLFGPCFMDLFTPYMGATVGVGGRLGRWEDRKGRQRAAYLDFRSDFTAIVYRPVLGVRIELRLPAVHHHFVARGGAHVSYSSFMPFMPYFTVGGGFTVPVDSRIAFRFELSGVVFPVMFSGTGGGPMLPWLPIDLAIGAVLRL